MRVRHSWVTYIIPALLAIICMAGSIAEIGKEDSGTVPMLIAALIIIALSVVNYFTSYLEVKNGMVKGSVGLIKKQRLSTPAQNINGCDVHKFLCFNKIKITSGLTYIDFRNMKDIDKIVEEIGK